MSNYVKYYIAVRLLLLKQYLVANAGGNRVVKRSELEEHLRKHDIFVEKKTLYADFAALGSVFGMQLEYDPHKKGYHLLNPPFELHDLRVMIDCVQAASFITEEEANTVTTKIMGLAPQRERNALSRYVEVRDRVQRAEDSVLRKVDIIQTALQNERQIRFRYFKYIAKRGNHKEYYKTKNGDEYITIHPWKLVSENHCYFLEHFSDNGSPLDHALLPSRFEIVRMENIEVLGEPRKKADMRRHTWARELANEMMFGKEVPVTIRFRNGCIQDVLEVFGADIPIIPIDDKHFKIVIMSQICPEAFTNLLDIGCYGKVIAPPNAVEEMKRCIRDMANLYEKDEEPYYVLTEKELYELYAEEPELDEEILKQMLPDDADWDEDIEKDGEM